MKKLLKWAGIIIGVLVGILVVAAIAVPLFLPLDKIKDIATDKISAAINREVKVEKVSFNIFSGVKLEKLTIANRKGFANKPFISADAIELHYAFWPIFKRQLLVKEVSLIKPQILIEKTKAGTFNYSDMTQKKAEGKVGGKEKGKNKEEKNKKTFSLIVDSFSIRKGLITYIDYGTGAESELKNANLALSGFTLALIKPIDLNFSATATYKKKTIPLSLNGRISIDLNKQALNIPGLTLGVAGEKATINLKVAQWKTAPDVDFAISSKRISLDPLLAVFAGTKKPAKKTSATTTASAGKPLNFKAKIQVDIDNLSLLTFKMKSLDLNASFKGTRTSLAGISGQGEVVLKGSKLDKIPALIEVGKLVNSNSLQEGVRVDELKANFTLKNQVLSTKDLKIEGQDLKASFSGGANLGRQTWVAGNRLKLKLSPETTKDLPQQFELLRNKSGWLEATFELKGSLKKPIPNPIFDKVIEKVVDKYKVKIEAQTIEIEKKAQKKLEEEAKKQIQNIFGF